MGRGVREQVGALSFVPKSITGRFIILKPTLLMRASTIVLILLIFLLIGALPAWPYSAGWGYYPSGGLGMLAVIVIILLLLGRI